MLAISKRGLLLPALLIGLISLVGLAVMSPRADAARSFNTAIVDADAFEHGSDAAFDHAAASGATIIRNNLYWAYVLADGESTTKPGTELQPFDPTDPASPYYHWATFDKIVRKSAARGISVVFAVVSPPRWARISSCQGSGVCSPKPSDYADFVTAAARRYSGTFDPGDGDGVLPRVRFWQAWVEPNLSLFYKPIFKGNGAPSAPYTFRNLLNAFYDAVHSVNNSNFVIAGGLAPNAVPGKAIAPLDFTRRALCMTGSYKRPKPIRGCNFKVKADAWAVHPYTTGSPVHSPSKPDNMTVSALPRMTNLLRKATQAKRLTSRFGRTQLWVTEFSWDSKPSDPGGVPSKLLSRWVAQAMYLAYKANVQTFTWFGLRDQARSSGQKWSDTFESGLYFRRASVDKDKAKPVLKAFRQPFYAEKTRAGFRFWGRTADSQKATVDIFGRRKGSGRFSRVTTVQANANGLFAGVVRRRGFTARGSVFAKPRGASSSIAFGLWKTRDFYQPPFG
ncbi:MAG: hypothetical protein KDB54_00610 [Solirubrobacterales bacterium]|nr:hypothetical protein [Solirubrobacterales bacterium]HRV59030.1 hypothetical protein [Solirubrobacterales bacterium]